MTNQANRASADLRDPLIAAAIAHVPFDGWSERALAAAASDLGLENGRERLVFPDHSPAALIEAWSAHITRAMTARLDGQLAQLRISERISTLVRTRLELMAPHREAVRRALAIMALPVNAPRAARLGWQAADALWRLAGDTSTDWNHYSKRAILAGVMASTLLVWVDDESEGSADTLAFLDRRIAGVLRFEKAKRQFAQQRETWPSLTRFLGKLRYPAA